MRDERRIGIWDNYYDQANQLVVEKSDGCWYDLTVADLAEAIAASLSQDDNVKEETDG
jgi:hypothetical protein